MPRPAVSAALEVLVAGDLAPVVDLVVAADGPGLLVANAGGRVRLDGGELRLLAGRNPLARTDPLAAASVAAERADPHPPNARNDYPFAAARLAGLFADRTRSPDLVVVHSDAHHWPERGGHRGEHGSLSVRQSRGPFVLCGPGVASRGVLRSAVRVIDVAPILLAACGLPVPPGLDGQVPAELISGPGGPVVGLLWDGANGSAVLDGARSGELPAVARLLSRGLALAGGTVAEFPSVTLVNHTSALTGLVPGRHGIVHNAFYDRETSSTVLANDIATWHRAGELLRPGVRTVFEVAADRSTACVNEPVDRGARYSTFALVRATGSSDGARSLQDRLPPAADDPHADQAWVAADAEYAWSTQVDAFGLHQVIELWSAPDPPALTWWNTTLTDTGHHGGGAHSPEASASLRDADRRLGVFLDLLDDVGRLNTTTFLLTADHGSVAADPTCRGDWDDALSAAGIGFRDEGYGFLYL